MYLVVGLGTCGVPEICPVVGFMDKPLGKVDPGAMANVTPAPDTVG